MKKIFITLAVILGIFTADSFAAASKTSGTSQQVKKTMPFTKGLNLAVWLEANYTPDGKVAALSDSNRLRFGKQDFEDIKSLGVEIVRIPVHFQAFSSGSPDYIVNDWIWDALDKAVEWCTELKMYMIIDYHNNCQGSSKTSPDIEKILLKIWPQVAQRYKDSGEYVLYEIHNEPHMRSGNIENDVAKWAKIQGNVLKAIRETDKTHTVIVGAENWNSVTELLKLPDYKDQNIIYNFHDYSPMLFTHQGTVWTDYKCVKGVPFPYVKEKMPEIPEEAPDWVKQEIKNYPEDSKEVNLVKPLDEAVKLANKRGVALMCNEWGVSQTYADKNERTSWYKLKAKWMDERNIIRVSWGYREPIGIFNNSSLKQYEARFPEDLNKDLLEAMGFNLPGKTAHHPSWIDSAKKKNDFTIYKSGFAENILCDNSWLEDDSDSELKSMIYKRDFADEPYYIYLKKAKPYNHLDIDFCGDCDFTALFGSGKSLEFEIRSNQKDLAMDLYFMQQEVNGAGKAGLPWRAQTSLKKNSVPADGKWHKVSIPLKDFYESGAYSNAQQKWYNGEGLFSWKKVHNLVFDFGEKGLQKDVSIREIVIR